MGLFKRISDIISANMQELVDDAENPEAVLKQAVDEMAAAIVDARRATARAVANEKVLGRKLADQRVDASLCAQRAEDAVRDGDDDRARQSLLRKQEHDRTVVALSDQLAVAGESASSLRQQLEQMQTKLAEAKRSLATLTARHRAAQVKRQAVEPSITDAPFAKFDRMSEKIAMAEAEADAMLELAAQLVMSDPSPNELDNGCVDAELAELKQKVKA